MKSKNRIRKNLSAATSSPQAKTTAEKSTEVIFYSTEDGKEMFRADLPDAILAAVQRASKKLRITMDEFFQQAIKHKIARELPVKSLTHTAFQLVHWRCQLKAKKSEMEYNGEEARLALVGVESKALEQWRVNRFNKKANIHHVAHYAMLFALTNPKKFSDWLENLTNYCKAEDIRELTYLRSLIVARYKTKKLKLA